MIVLPPFWPVLKVMETKTRKELYSSDNAILSAISDGKLFLYEGDRTMSDMKYMTKNAKISVISLSNGKVLKEISLNDYESLDAYYSTIRDGKVYFNINKNIYSLAL